MLKLLPQCRACLCTAPNSDTRDDFVDLLELFVLSNGEVISHLQSFNDSTNLHITTEHLLGKQSKDREADCRYLCARCSQELKDAYEFIMKARSSDAVLQKAIDNEIIELKLEEAELSNDEYDKGMTLIETLEENLNGGSRLNVDNNEQANALRNASRQTYKELDKELEEILNAKEDDVVFRPTPQPTKTTTATATATATTVLKEHNDNESSADEFEFLICNDETTTSEGIVEEITNISSDTPKYQTDEEEIEEDEEHGEDDEHDSDNVDGENDDDDYDDHDEELDDEEDEEGEEDDEDDDEEEEDPANFFEFKCELCPTKFDFQRGLIQHYERDHDDENLHYPCELCESRFLTENTLAIHRRQIHAKCEYIDCKLCGRTVHKSFFKVHMQRHENKKFLCSTCPNTFTTKYTLKKHMELHSEDRNRTIVCEDCDCRFYTNEHLQLHRVIHEDPNLSTTYTCTICLKKFMRQSNLKLHMQMHRSDTIDCKHCGKKFVHQRDLEIHNRSHTDAFPYSCSVCSKTFAIKGHLKAHEIKHVGIRYQCNRCDKDFINPSGLKQHSYEHTGMPLVCNLCMRGFPTKSKIRRHLRTVHPKFFVNSFSETVAEQFITQHDEVKTQTQNLVDVEMLEEHQNDISTDMLTSLTT